MGAVKKQTRKFEKKHLKRTLDDRKEKKKIKQQFALRDKKKNKRASHRTADADGSDADDDGAKKAAEKAATGAPTTFEDMSVEQFFQGGFEIPEPETAGKAKKGKKEKKEAAAKKAGGKRKRDQEAEAEADEDASDAGSAAGPGSDDDDDDDDELERHKKDIEELAKKDPDFYKYLKENDAELLDFSVAEADDLSAVDELSEGESDAEAPKKKKKTKKSEESDEESENETGGKAAVAVKMADVNKWKEALVNEKSLRALRQVALAFRAAAHTNDVEDKPKAQAVGYKYEITSPEVYHELLLVTLEHVPGVLNHHLPVKESAAGKIRVATETKKYRTLTPLLKSHASSLLHLLSSLTDAPTQKLVLNSTVNLLPYFLSFRKFLRSFLKAVVDIWAANGSDEATRITAFLIVRRTAEIGDEGLKEMCLKALYAGLVKASRQTTTHTLAGINLMKNSAAEVLGLPGMDRVGYQAGFGYIRQLAVHLRNSITKNSNESYKTIYNWQYVHCLDFWSRVLASQCDGFREAQAGKESPLRPLIYPLVQVTLGAIRLIPTAQYFPLRFLLVRALLRLSRATGVYIPLAPLVFEVLASAELKKKPKPSTLAPLDFGTHIRAPKPYLRSRTYQDGVGEQCVELLAEFHGLYATSPAFPELAVPAAVLLRRHVKKSASAKRNAALGVLVAKLDAQARWVAERRSKLEFAPSRRDAVAAFARDVDWAATPLGAYVVNQRRVREQKRQLLEESERQERERSRKDKEEAAAAELDGESESEGGSGSEDEMEVDGSEAELDGSEAELDGSEAELDGSEAELDEMDEDSDDS